MILRHASEIEPQAVREGISIRWLLTEKDGAPNFAMRVIELQPGVEFAPHHHPFEHEIYVLEGAGVLLSDAGEVGMMAPGKFLLVPPDEPHGYRNCGAGPLRFICVIPSGNVPQS